MSNVDMFIAEGVFRQRGSSIPEVSSVAWSSIITGVNPGEHGIFGFTDLAPETYGTEQKADLVLGKREKIFRISERFINWLTNLKVKAADSGTGFRAMKKDLALKLDLKGRCTCGILVLEANHHNARIAEVPITLRHIPKKRKIAWSHLWQIFYVLPWLFRRTLKDLKKKLNQLKELNKLK